MKCGRKEGAEKNGSRDILLNIYALATVESTGGTYIGVFSASFFFLIEGGVNQNFLTKNKCIKSNENRF